MFLTSSESALALTGLYSGFLIVNVTIELLFSKAPCQFLGLNGLIGVVPQDTIMFNNTIGYNLSYGNPNASKKEIRKVVKLCNLDDFIESLDLKYETIVGERGLKLSGGE